MNHMVKPKSLKEGDKIALIAPSSPVSKEKLEIAVESVKFLGLKPIPYPTSSMKHGYLSGTDLARARDINVAFSDDTIDGIFCLRGGYGANRLLNMLDYKTIRKNPKVFLGYSDVTVLHNVLNMRCNLVTINGPMPSRGYDSLDPVTLSTLKENLFSNKPIGPAPYIEGESIETISPGLSEGITIGGNLSLLSATLGSPYEIDTNGKIIFIEEVEERNYKLDRNLTALSLSGKFKNCAGVILGAFTDCGDPDIETRDNLSLEEIVEEVIKPFNKPIIKNFKSGHSYPQVVFPMGVKTRLDATNGIVTFLESATK